MRVTLVATTAHPAVARLVPAPATLAAQGAIRKALAAPSAEPTREGIPYTGLEATAPDAAPDAARRTIASRYPLIVPLGGGALPAAAPQAPGRGEAAPLLPVDRCC